MEQENLMEELLKEAKKRNTFLVLITGFFITFWVLFSVGFILFVSAITKVTDTMDHLDAAAMEMQTAVEDMKQLTNGLSQTNDLLNDFVSDNSQAMSETIDKMNHVDFDTLNDAIVKLRDAVEPFSKVVNFFK